MQVNHLRYFAEVARCGSINQAAQLLFISPQALSSSIASLEAELGYKLFKRYHHGMVLTEPGKQVYEDLQTLLPRMMGWFDLGRDQGASCAGKVQIYVALSLCASFNRLLIQQGRDCPDLEVTIHEARSDLIRSLFQSGKANLGLISVAEDLQSSWEAEAKENGWKIVKLMEDRFCAVLGKDYFPDLQGPLTGEECAKMRYISSSDEHDSISRRFAPHFKDWMQSKTESLSSNLCMVALNEGVVILPQRAAQFEPLFQSGILRVLPVQDIALNSIHYVCCAHPNSASSAERFLMDQIVEFYTQTDCGPSRAVKTLGP